MPLKPVDTYPAGGVDSRSNPINMPPGRYLYVRDLWPQQDGSFRLRDGYSQYVAGLQANVPIYSIQAVVGPGPNYNPLIVFWQNKTPYTLDPSMLTITSPTVKGAAIASASRWTYFYTDGHLHAFNGTDAKWFDGVYWRDIGLPTLTAAQLKSIVVSLGLAGITGTQGAAATLAFSSGGSWAGRSGGDEFGRNFYWCLFNPANNEISPGTILGSGPISGASGQQLAITGLPAVPTGLIGLIAMTDDDGGVGTNAYFASTITALSPNPVTVSQSGSTVTVTLPSSAGLPSVNQVVELFYVDGGGASHVIGPANVTAASGSAFSFSWAQPITPFSGKVAFWKLLTVAAGGTSVTIPGVNQFPPNVNPPGGNSFVTTSYIANQGLAASSIEGPQPGYQLYVSIYNIVTGHVGNRTPIGPRLAPTVPVNLVLTGLPVFTDSEWTLLIGRTSDGAEIPYAIIDSYGNWINAANGVTSLTIVQSNIDGNSELPSRNYPPPGTLDYNYQLSLLPGGAVQNPPVSGTFSSAWVESDHCCGSFAGQPTIYRSGSALDLREGVFVGLPEQSWDPADIETFPTAAPIVGGQGYQQESWVYSRSDCAALMELAGELSWQGPWNVGLAGQYAWTLGWQNLPFWITGDKQLATISGGGYLQMGGLMTTAASGPILISDEYEAALLSQIGSQYLSQTEVLYIRKPLERIEVLRIQARDSNGNPLTIIHDFNLRDANSPYGQGYLEVFQGALGTPTQGFTVIGIVSVGVGGSSNVSLTLSGAPTGLTVGATVDVVLNSPFTTESMTNAVITAIVGNVISYTLPTQHNISSQACSGTVSLGAPPTFAVIRDQNWQTQILGGAQNGILYELYSGNSDNGSNFTGQALALIYIGPERTAIKFLEWYGDRTAQFFIAKELEGTTFDSSQMQALCADAPDEVQGDSGSLHWIVDIECPEMIHAYLLLELTSHPADGSVGLNSPPHIPLEEYGRVWLVSPLAGVSRGK